MRAHNLPFRLSPEGGITTGIEGVGDLFIILAKDLMSLGSIVPLLTRLT